MFLAAFQFRLNMFLEPTLILIGVRSRPSCCAGRQALNPLLSGYEDSGAQATSDWDASASRARIEAEGLFGAIEPLEYVTSVDDLGQTVGPRLACELGQGTCSPPTDELFVECPFCSGGHRMA